MLCPRRCYAGLTLLGLALAGCGPAVPREELGEVQFTLPSLPGTDKPYPLPELEQANLEQGDDAAAADKAEPAAEP